MKEVIIKYFGDKIESHEIVEEVGELIRCKDCKRFSQGYCTKFEIVCLKPIDYCSRAERKTE